MKLNFDNDLFRRLRIGAFAGQFGRFAMTGTAQLMYNLTSTQKKLEEKSIEPRDPFIVLADKLQDATGIKMSRTQKKLFEKAVLSIIGTGSGIAYAAIARKWNLNWVAGGALFGTLFWLIEDEGMGTALGLVGDNTKYPLEAHARGLVAHIAFGVVTAAVHQLFIKDK